MFNWYDGEVEVQRHKDASRAAAERYATDEAARRRSGRSVLGRLLDFAARVLLNRRRHKQPLDPLSGQSSYVPRRTQPGD